MIKFQMPNLGADMEAGTLVEWRKQLGEFLHRGDIIADVETQKGLIEIEVFEEGTLEKFLVKEGEKVPVGTVLALINDGKSEVTESTVSGEEIQKPEIHPIEDRKEIVHENTELGERIKISPLARKIAEENRIDISLLKGTGPEGSIVKKDIEKAISEVKKPIKDAEKEADKTKEISVKPSGPTSDAMRMAVAAAMSKSNREIPHYYLEKRMDMSKAMDWVKEANKDRPVQNRLLPVAVLIKAVAKALDEVPDLNATWENGLHRKNEINIGFVISLRSGGIVVPAILQSDSKTVDEIMETINDIIPRARAFKLRSSELSQSTFTITNIGEGGADKVFGLIYPPQVGIVGFGEISEQPFAEEGMLGIRPVVDVTLAADHRATDGLIGSRFLAALNRHLQNPEEL
ncbi:2-oxo acid dehydrogenase subunit E2 [Algoriphagus lutimaris]|uniref:dihydrolipoamide acetyltransferase family protein n=1 Tax=Algoriphagus lutimaris TaxID=613197 RepID=UPI00196B3E66|nr:dihydrolipoamide acetyltransferase family protein [Algoriphagus lutimaris]MBN3520834.1 2-oxo acid dehydrogenase subunit E2 [Algoriphagus lutimaris]